MVKLSCPADPKCVNQHSVTSRHVTSRHVTSRHVTSRHVTSRHVTSRHVTSRHVTVTSRHVTSRHVTSRHVTSRHVTSRHVTSRHVTSRHVTSRHVTSRHVTSRHVTSRHVTSVWFLVDGAHGPDSKQSGAMTSPSFYSTISSVLSPKLDSAQVRAVRRISLSFFCPRLILCPQLARLCLRHSAARCLMDQLSSQCSSFCGALPRSAVRSWAFFCYPLL